MHVYCLLLSMIKLTPYGMHVDKGSFTPQERGSNIGHDSILMNQCIALTLYMPQINVLHLRNSYALKVYHSYVEKYCHHQEGGDY